MFILWFPMLWMPIAADRPMRRCINYLHRVLIKMESTYRHILSSRSSSKSGTTVCSLATSAASMKLEFQRALHETACVIVPQSTSTSTVLAVLTFQPVPSPATTPAKLISVVVNARMDYCDTVLAGAPRTVTDKLQRVLNAAARVITGTRKFDRGLGQTLYDQLHWLDVPDRVFFKLAVTVHQCLKGLAPPYLSEHCIPVSSADTRRHLRSANRHLLAVPRS